MLSLVQRPAMSAAAAAAVVAAASRALHSAAAASAKKPIDWSKLVFGYTDTDAHVEFSYKDGAWDNGVLKTEPFVKIHINSNVLHYGQCLFEGLKAFELKNGKVAVFQPDNGNAKRLRRGCERIAMPTVTDEMFNSAVSQVIHANRRFVPPYSTGASLYIRPFMFGHGAQLGLGAAPEYKFIVTVTPVGAYYKGALTGVDALVIGDSDRAAPRGVGSVKVGGNYAADLVPSSQAKAKGFPIALYLDAKTNNYVEEFSSSNFVAITHDNVFVTPESPSILASITNKALQQLALDRGMKVERRPIPLKEVRSFKEVGACGTAVVLTPINSLTYGSDVMKFQGFETLQALRDEVCQIQRGDIPDKHGWLQIVA
eukprot:m.59457 g.59457  ORF g.59457 m.59457 type:complete len:370 (-) comp13582_c0_seq1:280-1389(-)